MAAVAAKWKPPGATDGHPPPPIPSGISPRVREGSTAEKAIREAMAVPNWKDIKLPANCLTAPPEVAAAFHCLVTKAHGGDPMQQHPPSTPCAFAQILGGCGSKNGPSLRTCPRCEVRSQWKRVPKDLLPMLKAGATAQMATRVIDTG